MDTDMDMDMDTDMDTDMGTDMDIDMDMDMDMDMDIDMDMDMDTDMDTDTDIHRQTDRLMQSYRAVGFENCMYAIQQPLIEHASQHVLHIKHQCWSSRLYVNICRAYVLISLHTKRNMPLNIPRIQSATAVIMHVHVRLGYIRNINTTHASM
jgi:hypothetical protein